MTKLLSQAQLEAQCAEDGLTRLLADSQQAESTGRASGSFYAKHILEKYIERVIANVTEQRAIVKPGRNAAHASLVKSFDPGIIAYIAVSRALDVAMQGGEDEHLPVTRLRYDIGSALYNELFCKTFDKVNPDLFYTISKDLNKRQSKQSRHRMAVLKMQATKNNISWTQWSVANIHQVGDWCIDMLVEANMIELFEQRKSHTKTVRFLNLTDEALDLITDTKRIVSYFRPHRMPFVEKPLDWTGLTGGGYHTKRLQQTFSRCVKVSPTQMEVISKRQRDFIPTVVRCINKLQSVKWQVNTRILDVQQAMFKGFEAVDRVPALDFHDTDKETWNDDQLKEHKTWCIQKAKQYTAQKAERYEISRAAMTLSTARDYAAYPELYFMYFADWRGRYYPLTRGISPQGPDNQKSMLQFANGKPLNSKEAIEFFLLLGSTKFGFDKGNIEERIQWVHQHHDIIMACADEPLLHTDWWFREVGKKTRFQFLAWCFEYAEWKRNPLTFVNKLPCSLDGTCNGLQHYSGMFLDEDGARATNLLPSERPNDIYQQVADWVTEQLKTCDISSHGLIFREVLPLTLYELEDFRGAWLAHGINRKLTKRCVMTLPYGSKKFSMGKFIRSDYMFEYQPAEFELSDYKDAATFLGDYVWNGIGSVAVKAVEGMNYFQGMSRAITRKKDVEYIWWTSVTGMPIVQAYYETEYVQFRSKQNGSTHLKVLMETDGIDKMGHANGIAPNIIHSFDSGHLTFTVLDCDDAGIDELAMVHDDYGTLAADTAFLAKAIRSNFVKIYEKMPFERLAAELESQTNGKKLPTRPAYGTLKIQEVLNSTFFFL